MARSKPKTQSLIYQLKITLCDTKPPIWRRIEVPGSTRLDRLHLMIQAAMGWHNGHLHCFTIDGESYGMRNEEFDMDCEDEKDYQLDEVVQHGQAKFLYKYDFGDNWEHDVRVEKIAPPEAGMKYPRCIMGARACPPEDVGSTWGYAEFLRAIRDPKHEEHESLLDWIGGKFDPEAFDIAEADAAVKDFKSMQVFS